MKKFLLAILSSILCLSMFAQETTDVNRLLIYEKSGNMKGYVLDRVDYMEFETIEGEVAANVTVNEVTLEKVNLSVFRTESCEAYKLSCYPTSRIASYSDDVLASMVDSESSDLYFEDFESADMTGIEFDPITDYTIVTVGIDGFGILCDVRKVEFTTPSKPLVGDPQVAVEEVDIQQFEFTLKFTPNADVSKYSVLSGEKGSLMSQFEMFAPMFGYANVGQMIEGWGVQFTEESEFTWKSMQPGKEYEVFIQAWDAEGTMAQHQEYYLTTKSLGGEGTAEVTITLGDYVLADWGGEMLPSQFVTYTPNDQASAYRFNVYLAEEYDPVAEDIKADLCTEPPMPMTGWFFYEPITTDYQINPNTECVIIAAAKNINGEWGPINEFRFTTPAEAVAADMAPSRVIAKRNMENNAHQAGTLPAQVKSNKVMLIGK